MRLYSAIPALFVLVLVAGPREAHADSPSTSAITEASTRAIALMQRSVTSWDSQQTCFSCHHQGMVIDVLQSARMHGVPLDDAAARTSTARVFRWLGNLDLAVQAVQQSDPAMTTASWLVTAHKAGAAPNLVTAVYARLLASRQEPDGHWITLDARPPQSFSQITATALSARAIALHLPAALAADREARLTRARGWLRSVSVADTEDRTFQLLGLAWCGEPAAARRSLAESLLARQRSDGGWSQIDTLASDAYATGEVLYALRVAGGVAPDHPGFQRGLQFLLKAQQADGSWLVKTRIHEQDLVSPQFFETGYPHGRDQISSLNAAAWAILALMEALPVSAPDATVLPAETVAAAPGAVLAEEPWMKPALFGSVAELTALLDQGASPNAHTAAGTTLLMMAAHDPAKVKLLLSRGADPRAVSQARHTALMVAANQRGAIESMKLLLAAGAPAESSEPERRGRGAAVSPLLYAVWSREPEKVRLLLDRGATIPRRFSIGGGVFFATPLELSVFQRDTATATLLVSRGANVNELGENGASPLTGAIVGDDVTTVRALLALGADVNLVDQQGETALMHAAQIDFGNTEVVDALLAAGAIRTTQSPDKLTAADLAAKHGHAAIRQRITAAAQ